LTRGRSEQASAGGGGLRASRPAGEIKLNPIWTQMIYNAAKEVMRVCTHCKKASAYQMKPRGRYYKCPYCGHRFKEKGA
jgi:DNA-directed RNA polymerase subunit RPC12/RpoP